MVLQWRGEQIDTKEQQKCTIMKPPSYMPSYFIAWINKGNTHARVRTCNDRVKYYSKQI